MVLILGGLAFLQYFTSDKIALAASGAKVVRPEEAPELHAMVDRLCAMADLPKPRVAIIPTDMPNAFATGRSPKHSAVAVTEGLWRRLEPREVEGVLAHELSHIANRDVAVMTIASFFSMLAAFLMRMGMFAGMFGGGRNRDGGAPAFLIMLVVSLVTYVISVRAHPDDLALPRVRGRPRRRADHRRAGAADERPPEDRQRHDADPPARPAPGRGHERVLHHPDEPEVGRRRALHDPSAAREAPRPPRRDRAEMGRPVAA